MLTFYLKTVIVWMIILYATATLCGPAIKEKGWLKNNTSTNKGKFSTLFILAAVPFIRSLIWVFILVMTIYTPEQLKEKMKE